MYASWTGTAWTITTVDDDVAHYTPYLAFDSHDNPCITYADIIYTSYVYPIVVTTSSGILTYARWTGSEWDIQPVFLGNDKGSSGASGCLVLDSDDNPRIFYGGINSYYEIRYASYNGSRWTTDVVDTARFGNVHVGFIFGGYALDPLGNPHLVYQREEELGFKHAYYEGSSWHFDAFEWGADVYRGGSLAIDATGRFHILYYSADDNCCLRYAVSSPTGWTITTIDTNMGLPMYTSIALDSLGNPHTSYYNYRNSSLHYAWFNGSAWDMRTITAIAASKLIVEDPHCLLALDSNDQAHITYYSSPDKSIKYLDITDPDTFPKVDIHPTPYTPPPAPTPPPPSPTPTPSTSQSTQTSSTQSEVSVATPTPPPQDCIAAPPTPLPARTPDPPQPNRDGAVSGGGSTKEFSILPMVMVAVVVVSFAVLSAAKPILTARIRHRRLL